MQIILLERVPKLGQMGEVVTVRAGFARNFLIPKGKALRATKASIGDFEKRRAQLEARNLERKPNAFARYNRVMLSEVDGFAHDLFAFMSTGNRNEAAAPTAASGPVRALAGAA